MKPARILIAEDKRLMNKVKAALAGYEPLTTSSIHQAEGLVSKNNIDIYVIGIHSDDSRAMQLVKFIRLDCGDKKTPILVTRMLPSKLSAFLDHDDSNGECLHCQ